MDLTEKLRQSLDRAHANRLNRLADDIRAGRVEVDPYLCDAARSVVAEIARKGREWGLGVRHYHMRFRENGEGSRRC